MIRTINQKVSIEPKYLDSNISNHLLKKLKDTMEGKCSLDNGYILSVNKIIKLGENMIECPNSFVIFNVIYEVTVLKPEKNQIMSGTVCMVFQHGIFVDIMGKLKVLIPATSMSELKYTLEKNSFVGDNITISDKTDVTIKITATHYEKKQFSCIGILCTYSTTSSDADSKGD